MKRFLKRIKKKYRLWRRGDNLYYTIECDFSQWYGGGISLDGKDRTQLFRIRGIKLVKRFCWDWIMKHPCGSTKVFKGLVYWPDELKK